MGGRFIGVALAALSIVASTASAQTPTGGVFAGQIVDSISGEPIEGVLVRLDTGLEAFTDARGEFDFGGLPTGRRLYALLSKDCRITWGEIEVIDGIPRNVRLRLPPAFGAAADDEQRDAVERRRTGGKYVEAAEIDRMGARSVTEVIRRVAPNMVSGVTGAVGSTSSFTSGRTRSFLPDDPPVVVIEGIRIPDAEIVLTEMHPSEVQLLEVLPGSAAGWEFGSSGAGGVIKITLRRGLATGAPEQAPVAECAVPDFPGR